MSNIVLNPGAGGSTLATDTVAGVDTQIVKIGYSAAGVAPTQVSATNPLPIQAPSAIAVTGTFWQATQPVSGTVSISGTATVSGTVTANQGTANVTPWNENLSQYGGSAVGPTNAIHVQPGTGSQFTVVQSTAANLNATVVGTVTANQGGTWNINSITTLPAITGSVSVTNFPATQTVTGSVSVSNFPATQAVTGTFWQAVQPVSFSGAVTTGPISFTGPQPVYLDDQNTLMDDDGAQVVSINPNTDPATGALQSQTITALQTSLPRTVNGSVSVIGGVAASVSSLPLPPNASQENAGQLQRIADLMEAVLLELRVMSVLLSQQSSPAVDDADGIRNDLRASLQ